MPFNVMNVHACSKFLFFVSFTHAVVVINSIQRWLASEIAVNIVLCVLCVNIWSGGLYFSLSFDLSATILLLKYFCAVVLLYIMEMYVCVCVSSFV